MKAAPQPYDVEFDFFSDRNLTPKNQGGLRAALGKKVLERLSRETGGHMFVVSKKGTIGDIYRQIEDELRNQYSLGYTSDKPAGEGSDYSHIHVTTKQKDLTCRPAKATTHHNRWWRKDPSKPESELSVSGTTLARAHVR